MNITENILLQLTGRAIFNAPTDFDHATVDWFTLYQEATCQALPLLIWDILSDEERAAVPKTVAFRWEQESFGYIMHNEQLLYEQKQVIKILEDSNISCVILKGSSSAVNYPHPALRIMGDIDLLVKPQQQMDAVKVLQANGYEETLDGSNNYHVSVIKNGVTVQIHKEPNGMFVNEDTAIDKKLRAFFADAVDRRQIVEGLPFLADDQQAMVLLLHKLSHFLSGGLGLRQLCDWAVYVYKKMDEKLWERLHPLLNDFGLLTFTNIITKVCINYLYLPAEKAKWAIYADDGLTHDVMEQILKSGNFGIKTKGENYGIHYFTDAHSSNRLASFMKILVSHCKVHWPVCAKYPILMPIAPFVSYAKYLKLRKEGKRARIKPVSLYKKAGVKQKLYKELKPFIVE